MKYIKNITGPDSPDPRFKVPQTLGYIEVGKGNVPEFKNIPKKCDTVILKSGEQMETNLNGENISGEPRFKLIEEDKKPKVK